jgi:O-acetylserine/cysteine efflux transporter
VTVPGPPRSEASAWHGLAFSCAGALCSAAYLFPYKHASRFAPPDVLAFGLLLIAAVLNTALAAFTWTRGRTSVLPERRTLWIVSGSLAAVTISGNFCGAQAVTRLEPAITSVLLRTEVVFVGALGVLLLAERFTAALAGGALLALGGLTIMRWPLQLGSSQAGPLWALGAAASFGFMQVLTRRFIDRISPVAVNALRLWLAVGAMTLWPGLVHAVSSASAELWRYLALAALFGPFLGRLFIMFSLRTLRAAHSALLLLFAPVLAFVIGFLMTGVSPTGLELAGGALMLVGIALPSLERARSPAGGAGAP